MGTPGVRIEHMTISASRRRVLLGVTALVPAAVVLPARADAAEPEPECLADLIESGEVTRADLLAG